MSRVLPTASLLAVCLAPTAALGQQLEVPFGEFSSAAVDYAPTASNNYSLQATLGQTFVTVDPPTNVGQNLAYAGWGETAVKYRYTGSITFLGMVGSPAGIPVEVRFRPTNSTDISDTVLALVSPDGGYTVDSWMNPSKLGLVSVKPSTWLRQAQSFSLPAGPLAPFAFSHNPMPADFNNDNTCDFSDFETFLASFGLNAGEPGYNPVTDINRDNTCDFSDFELLLASFGLNGDE